MKHLILFTWSALAIAIFIYIFWTTDDPKNSVGGHERPYHTEPRLMEAPKLHCDPGFTLVWDYALKSSPGDDEGTVKVCRDKQGHETEPTR
jgi:hypothetical protein